jgi:hypothetical protein
LVDIEPKTGKGEIPEITFIRIKKLT